MTSKKCTPHMHMGTQDNCKHWHRNSFSLRGIFNDDGEMIDEEEAQWGYCDLLDKKFRYILGTEPPCETTRQTVLI